MNIIVVTPPPVEPVTIEEAFLHLRLDQPAGASADYAAVRSQIQASREQCEQYTRRAFVQQTLRATFSPMGDRSARRGWDWYMAGGGGSWGPVELPRPPLIEVVAVRYFDDANAQQVIAPSSYNVSPDLVPRLTFAEGFQGPSTYIRDDAVQIDYRAGYAPKPAGANPAAEPIDYRANVPESIKQAILLGVQMLYDKLTPAEREALERARDSLLSSYRIHKF